MFTPFDLYHIPGSRVRTGTWLALARILKDRHSVEDESCRRSISRPPRHRRVVIDVRYKLGEDKTKAVDRVGRTCRAEELLMVGTGALRLGPAARRLISPDRWTDGYPG